MEKRGEQRRVRCQNTLEVGSCCAFENFNSLHLGGGLSIRIFLFTKLYRQSSNVGSAFRETIGKTSSVYLCVPFIYTVDSGIKQKRKNSGESGGAEWAFKKRKKE